MLAALLLLGCDAFGPKLLSNDDRPFGSDAVPVPTPLPEEDRLICGDGLRSEDEECDDGNALSLDGCSQTCELEAGYDCGIPGRRCVSVCGDGIWTRQESCDDGNNVGEDGCSRDCDEERGYNCGRTLGSCETQCGDGIVAGQEVCDNRNQISGDGCSARCDEIEPGYVCAGQLVSNDLLAALIAQQASKSAQAAADAGTALGDAGVPRTDAGTPAASDAQAPGGPQSAAAMLPEPPAPGEVLIFEEQLTLLPGMTERWTLRVVTVTAAATYAGGRCVRFDEL